MAVSAGLAAQVAADVSGDIGPFQLAILLTVVTAAMVWFWRENKGQVGSGSEDSITSLFSGLKGASRRICASPGMLCLGLSQAFYEGAVYTFVFMWVPNMQLVAGTKSIPTGLVFTCFMLAMTLGGSISGALLSIIPGGAGGVCFLVYLIAAASMAVPIVWFEFWPVFTSFLVLEFTLGIFNAGGGTLRSKYYPESMQSSIMNVFRVPLNGLVVLGTKLTSWAGNDIAELQKVFLVVVGMHLAAAAFQLCLSLFCAAGADQTHHVATPSAKSPKASPRAATPKRGNKVSPTASGGARKRNK